MPTLAVHTQHRYYSVGSHTVQVLFCLFTLLQHSTGIVCCLSCLLVRFRLYFFGQNLYFFLTCLPQLLTYVCFILGIAGTAHTVALSVRQDLLLHYKSLSAIPFYVCRSLSLSLSSFFFFNLKPCFLTVFSDPHFAFLCRLYSLKFASLRLFGNSPCNLSPDKVLQGGAKG